MGEREADNELLYSSQREGWSSMTDIHLGLHVHV